MQLSFNLFITTIAFCFRILQEVNGFGIGEECMVVGSMSGVICVTETEYTFSLDTTEIYACEPGTVCANHPLVCVNDTQPACMTDRCNVCLPGATAGCSSMKTYADCIDGQMQSTRRNCQASRPYCRVDYNQGLPIVSCNAQSATCPAQTIPPPTEIPPPADECPDYGKFAVPLDTTCKRFYFCYHSNGRIARLEFMCPGNTVFDEGRSKCIEDENHQCGTQVLI